MAGKIIKKRGRPFGSTSKPKIITRKRITKKGKDAPLSAQGLTREAELARVGKDLNGKFVTGNTYRTGVIQNQFKKILADALTEGDYDNFKDIAHAYITKCKGGDIAAVIGLFNMFIPKAPTVEGVTGIKTGTAKEIMESMSSVISHAADGSISHEGAQNLIKMLESIRESIKVERLEAQLAEYDNLLMKAGIKK